MKKIQLVHLAHARSGDKGDTANVGVIAYEPGHYDLVITVTDEIPFLTSANYITSTRLLT